jgi:hypothetical protein
MPGSRTHETKTPQAKTARAAEPRKTAAASAKKKAARPQRAYIVRNSPIHGRGVFAARTIRKGADIIEYRGRRISAEAADDLPDSDPDNPFHTFLFELNDGRVIDAGDRPADERDDRCVRPRQIGRASGRARGGGLV